MKPKHGTGWEMGGFQEVIDPGPRPSKWGFRGKLGRSRERQQQMLRCGPCSAAVPADEKEDHRKTRQHQISLLRRKHFVEQHMVPFTLQTPATERMYFALLALLDKAGVRHFEDDVGVSFETDPETGLVREKEVTKGLYLPAWASLVLNLPCSTFEILDWLFEIASSAHVDDTAREQVASSITAMLSRHSKPTTP